VRNKNVLKVFKTIHKLTKEGPLTRKELTRKSEFSSGTISNHVNTLLKEDYLIEEDIGDSTGGRKPVYLNINAQRNYLLSIDIRVDGIKIYLFDLNLKPVSSYELKIAMKDFKKAISRLIEKINEVLTSENINLDKLIGIGVSVPGLIDEQREVLIFAPNLEWRKVNLAAELTEHFAVPVLVENDANCAVVGEKYQLYPEINNIVYVFIKEGVGCGVIINNELYRGTKGNAGEFGHMIVDYSKSAIPCYCGSKGCWETVASEVYILKRSQQALKNSGLTLNKSRIPELAKSNDKIKDIIKETGYNIGIGAVNIINSLSPKYLVFGGGIKKYKKYIGAEIKVAVENRTLESFSQDTEIVFSQLDDRAISIGMANLLFNNFFEIEQTKG